MSTKRIHYIDALRGFTMILVVMNHVSAYCFGVPFSLSEIVNGCYSFVPFFQEFRMPLFFFISGFVLYKATDVWNGYHIKRFFLKKIPIQIISPLIFFTVYLFLFNYSFHDGIFHVFKKGFWFTFTLFSFYLFYALFQFVFCNLKLKSKAADVALLGGSVIVFFLSKYVLNSKPIFDLLGCGTWFHYFYFILGTLAHKHFHYFECMLDHGFLVVMAIVLYFGLNIFYNYLPLQLIISILLALSGIVIVFSFFRKYYKSNESINTDKLSDYQIFKKVPLEFIGRRTLEIYLLHYFFLPYQLTLVCTVFHDYRMPVLETVCSLFVSMIVIAACLVVGSILRINPFMAHWLFGVKQVKKE